MNIFTGSIFKPERELYYIYPTEEEKQNFYQGILPDLLVKYDGAFGTYDSPGLFMIREQNCFKEVLGIEFRPNDSRIHYPEDCQSKKLPSGFMFELLYMGQDEFNHQTVEKIIDYAKENVKRYIFHLLVGVKQKQDMVQIFNLHNRKRIFIQTEEIPKAAFPEMLYPETKKEEMLYQLAYHDFITGHYNWNYLWALITGYGMKGIQDFVFIHFDVKEFHALNIVYGHDVANRVLDRIVKQMNKTDWVYFSARCDNDNFAMMVQDMEEEELRSRLLEFFDEISILEEDNNYHIYYRCGVVPMRNCLLLGERVADAGKQVQRMGNKPYETEVLFYTEAMHDEDDWLTHIKAYLDTAIRRDEFLIYLQPKYDIVTETVKGAEALIRWNYCGRGLLSPAKFIPIFENGGLIGKLDDVVLHKVCSCLKQWKEQGKPLFPISVNLSRKRMGSPDLIEHLTAIVDSYGIEHSLIDFELTESAVYEDQEYMISIIMKLKECGFKISMDDFGTGYSSLSLLTRMPMDTIKIDKSFVDRIDSQKEHANECVVLRYMIGMLKELGFTCLAEGAEDKAQIEKLREYGCEIVQGFYYSKPLPVEEYEALIERDGHVQSGSKFEK